MTEKEAIDVLKNFDSQVVAKADGAYQSTIGKMVCDAAIKALEEIQQYRAIGTVEECREAMEKRKPKRIAIISKKPLSIGVYAYYMCPACGKEICSGFYFAPINDYEESHKYCLKCGQTIDWSEEE